MKLGDALVLHYGKALPKEDREDSGAWGVYGANGPIAKSNRSLSESPTIIVGRKGSVGALKLVQEPCWPLDVCYYVGFDQEKYNLNFLYYLLLSLNLESLSKGVKPGLNRNDVYSLEVSIPDIDRQIQIAKNLDEKFTIMDQLDTEISVISSEINELRKSTLHFTLRGAE
jgi:type I restriction enzyme S subunit